jgi:Skp family chaperone for outer membrane proteins
VNKYSVIGMVWASVTLMAQAPAAAPAKMCVVNLQTAMLSTKDGQAAAEEFRTKFQEPEEKKLQARQQEMTELSDKLQRGANTMSQTAQDDMKRTLDRKNTEYKRAVEDFQFDRDDMQRKMLDDLSVKMQAVIDRFAQENACAVMLDITNPNSGIMWVATSAEVTRQIVDAYDKAQPAAGVSVAPAGAKPPASGVKPPAATPKPPAPKPPAQ